MVPSRVTLLTSFALALLAGAGRAACPVGGDIAPGTLSSGTWTIVGDGESTIADVLVGVRLLRGDWELAELPGCSLPGDLAPGVARDGQWIPIGNAALDACDAEIVGEIALGRRTLASAALDHPAQAEAHVAGLVALDDLDMTDEAFLGPLASQVEAIDAAPDGPGLLRAYLESEIGGDCMPLPPVSEGQPSQAQPQSLLDRVTGSIAWKVLEELLSTIVFAAVPSPGAELLQVAQPETAVALSTVIVRTQIVDAFIAGRISESQRGTLMELLRTNPFAAKAQLDQILGATPQPWADDVPAGCVRQCPELCLLTGDEDRDGLENCDDPDCLDEPECRPVEDCHALGDEDGDGQADCLDPDCQGVGACGETQCGNGADDDDDGFVDCGDTDCLDQAPCLETDCGDGSDDDGDGLVDCHDPNCSGDPACDTGERWCGCWFDVHGGFWWRCREQDNGTFAAPYNQLVAPGECSCNPDDTICE